MTLLAIWITTLLAVLDNLLHNARQFLCFYVILYKMLSRFAGFEKTNKITRLQSVPLFTHVYSLDA